MNKIKLPLPRRRHPLIGKFVDSSDVAALESAYDRLERRLALAVKRFEAAERLMEALEAASDGECVDDDEHVAAVWEWKEADRA